MIKGIDISKWQGDVTADSFRKAKASGVEFVFIKSSEGYGDDPEFQDNWAAAADAGLLCGAYHFARPDTHAKDHRADACKEAKNLCDSIDTAADAMGAPSWLPPALDYEKYFSGLSQKQKREWVRAFVGVVQHELDVSPTIYTGSNIWHYQLGDWAPEECPLWLVRYRAVYGAIDAIPEHDPHRDGLRFPMPWDNWTFLQWSGGGKYDNHGPVPGFKSPVDVNWFNGDLDDLHKLVGVDPKSVTAPTCPSRLEFSRDMLAMHTKEASRHSSIIEALEDA